VPLPTRKFLIPAAAVLGLAVILFVALKFLPHKAPAGPADTPVDAAAAKTDLKSAASRQTPTPTTSGAPAAKTASGTGPSPVKPPEAKDAKPPASAATAAAKKDEVRLPTELAKPGNPTPDMDSASLASARAGAARVLALKSGVSDNDLFFRLADAAAQEGQRLFAVRGYVEARSQLSVAEKAFRICQDRNTDDDRLAALKKLVEGLRADVESQKAFQAGDPIYVGALEIERKAVSLQARKETEKAGRSYLQAATAYDKLLRALQRIKS